VQQAFGSIRKAVAGVRQGFGNTRKAITGVQQAFGNIRKAVAGVRQGFGNIRNYAAALQRHFYPGGGLKTRKKGGIWQFFSDKAGFMLYISISFTDYQGVQAGITACTAK